MRRYRRQEGAMGAKWHGPTGKSYTVDQFIEPAENNLEKRSILPFLLSSPHYTKQQDFPSDYQLRRCYEVNTPLQREKG